MTLHKVRRHIICLIPVIVLMALASSLFAEDVVFEFDPTQTRVNYRLGDYLHGSQGIQGTFKLKSGQIHYDPATGVAGGLVVVDATSGSSGSDGRDSRMHKNILESERYPEITFTPARVQGAVAAQGQSRVEIQGLLNLHGVDHEVTITADVNPSGNQLIARTQFPVPYVLWGLKNPSTFILRVSTHVDIDITSSGRFTGLSGFRLPTMSAPVSVSGSR